MEIDKLEYLSKNFKTIFTSYVIPNIVKRITSAGAMGAASMPVLGGAMVLLANGIPLFKKKTPDIYPLIIKYCQRIGIDEPELYTKALVNKASFSKIRNMRSTGYMPSKSTVIRLCLVLRLSYEEAAEMLAIVGYALSNESLVDQVVHWCLVENCYEFEKIDEIIAKNGVADYSLLPNLS